MSPSSELRSRSWHRDGFAISTDPSLVPVDTLTSMFNDKGFYWGRAMPEEYMKEMLDSSLCFALYDKSTASAECEQRRLLGFSRLVTDFTTFAYLTDVWVDPKQQGQGLGSWLVQCVQDTIDSMPYLRRTVLFTSDWERSVPFYKRLMGMEIRPTVTVGSGNVLMERRFKEHPSNW